MHDIAKCDGMSCTETTIKSSLANSSSGLLGCEREENAKINYGIKAKLKIEIDEFFLFNSDHIASYKNTKNYQQKRQEEKRSNSTDNGLIVDFTLTFEMI